MSLDNIDRYIRDLNAIKNYDLILENWTKAAVEWGREAIRTKNLQAEVTDLSQKLTKTELESKRKDTELEERDKKIKQLEQTIVFLRAVLDKDIKEDDKESGK